MSWAAKDCEEKFLVKAQCLAFTCTFNESVNE